MNKITFPLRQGMRGQKVTDLQNALLLLLEKKRNLFAPPTPVTHVPQPPDWRKITVELKREREKAYYGKTTKWMVTNLQYHLHLPATGAVDKRTAEAINGLLQELGLLETEDGKKMFVIKGRISLEDGTPATGLTVQAFDRDLRHEQILGKCLSDKKGFYRIKYDRSKFKRAEKESADIVVKVFAAEGALLATSPVLFNAPKEAEIDLTIPASVLRPPSLFEAIGNAIKPLLDELKITELEENEKTQDISFLAGETGLAKRDVARFVLAFKLAELAKKILQPEFWFVLLGGSFYQFSEERNLDEQLSAILNRFPILDERAVRKALNRGFNLNEIPDDLKKMQEKWIKVFFEFVAEHQISKASQANFVKLALQNAGIKDRKKQKRFALLFNRYKTFSTDCLNALEKEGKFEKAEIENLHATFALSQFAQGNLSVVKQIQKKFHIHRPDEISTLARLSEKEWSDLIKEVENEIEMPSLPETPHNEAKRFTAEIYAKTLARQIRTAFPTSAFCGDLDRAKGHNQIKGIRHIEQLSQVLDRHTDFDFLHTPIDSFLEKSLHPSLGHLVKNEDFRLELKAIQRVFKLAPSLDAVDALLADNLHSAQQIYRIGESQFVQRYGEKSGFTKEYAKEVWNRAAETHAAVLTLLGDIQSMGSADLPWALRGGQLALDDFPNWENLFQSGDLCNCEHCRSALAPAAYFADLLMFLKGRNAKDGSTVKDVLIKRRPDLGYLELNCDNALTPLPYIDVVCEVLEEAIAGNDGDIKLKTLSAIPTTDIEKVLREAFDEAFKLEENKNKQIIPLGQNISLSTLDNDHWIVHSDRVSYLIYKNRSSSYFAKILRNTKADAEELRAYPQYVNPAAYDRLKQAKYPWSLPFDLFSDEVKAAFGKSRLRRWDLMLTFQGNDAPNNALDVDIAAEYFGISVNPDAFLDEKRLMLEADASSVGQQAVWGEDSQNWYADFNIKTFLHKTDLTYEQLLALLDLKFINPHGTLVIQHEDSSCDTDKKTLQGLDLSATDRIHRFLRMWRKLDDWEMWELDMVLAHPAIGNGSLDEAFLLNLYYFERFRDKLGKEVSVEEMCALFGDLNTRSHFVGAYKNREDGLYQKLFLNPLLIQPIDPAFRIDPSTGDLPAGENIGDHVPAILAALGLSESELEILRKLKKVSDESSYLADAALNLQNLSFLWRHAWLWRHLKYRAEEWQIVLKLFNQDLFAFESPENAWEFVQWMEVLKKSDFSADDLAWLLTADSSSKSAVRESNAAHFLTGLRSALQAIRQEYDEAQYPFLADPPTDVENLTALLTSLLQKLGRDDAQVQYFIATLKGEASVAAKVEDMPPGFEFPKSITDTIPIHYEEEKDDQGKGTIRFTGVITENEKNTLLTDPSLSDVTNIQSYKDAIEELYLRPRLILKFFEPRFVVPLEHLPEEIDFKNLPDPGLAQKITYDAERRLLIFNGIMTAEEKTALKNLSSDQDYQNAIEDLASQPKSIQSPDRRIWLVDDDLHFPLPDNLAENLATAVKKALAYLQQTLAEKELVAQCSEKLNIDEALTEYLLNHYQVLPVDSEKITLLDYFTGDFVSSTAAIDYDTYKTAFDGWFWVNRVASMWEKWQITLKDFEKLSMLTDSNSAQLLDFSQLPLDESSGDAPVESFLKTVGFLRLKATLPETDITLWDVLEKLSGTAYSADNFAADVEGLNSSWSKEEVKSLVESLNLQYPDEYLKPESWERMRRAFYYLDALNAGVGKVKQFAAPSMGFEEAKLIKELLRSKFGGETWLNLSREIQDILREKKRDALAAYLLAQPKSDDAPTGKWENTNDLYAYYLLDIEMSSCQLTSRLVQASGSIQLFVQRCFMGLEPKVEVKSEGDEGDSGWNWWKWMRKYRVWEANRKIFLWPENWIEPELRKDKSSFFKDMENALLQNEINQENVEKAFIDYLEKLEGVDQLEIAGFYQEDNGDEAIIHLFGRTKGTPHLYYYRRYDYRQWSPWEKVDLDIHGEYLIPAVINHRLFLFWPVFTEVPDEQRNSSMQVPNAGGTNFTPDKPKKRLRLQMAFSEYRNGKWAPKKISKDYDESKVYEGELVKKFYRFIPVDLSEIDNRFVIKYDGYGMTRKIGSGDGVGSWCLHPDNSADECLSARLSGAFELSGCKGLPEISSLSGNFKPVLRVEQDSVGQYPAYMKWKELGQKDEFRISKGRDDRPNDDFTLINTSLKQDDIEQTGHSNSISILNLTPGFFRMTPPWQFSYFDRLYAAGLDVLGKRGYEYLLNVGTWLPFYYNDQARTFFVLPALEDNGPLKLEGVSYYPEIKQKTQEFQKQLEKTVDSWIETLSPEDRKNWAQYYRIPIEDKTDEEIKELLLQYFHRLINLWAGQLALSLLSMSKYHFKNFYHPFVCDFARLVYNPLEGIPGLMHRQTQLKESGFRFADTHEPTDNVLKGEDGKYYPGEIVDFSPDGAYSPYNWELFFHAPLMIANQLSRNQRFEEAREWYHFIFNPIGLESTVPGGSPMSKYWITKPFFETTKKEYWNQRIDNILKMLAGEGSSEEERKKLENQVKDWHNNPFEPHRIAIYRTVAYQKNVVMKYLDNLIAWGDNLFRQDSMESINEATQLYIMAAEILGPRPRKVPPRTKPPVRCFKELEESLDAFSNALINVENLVPQLPGNGPNGSNQPPLPMLYFCVPRNDKMLEYWDTVADRLFKIRHCMNIEGVERQLALFEPPIEPGALVKAVAAGVDIGSVLADMNAPLPFYRFNVLLQKANEVCSDVKALGSALLAALEKKDAEELARLRQSHEIRLLEAVKAIREKQIEEAKENLKGLKKSKELAKIKKQYYESREFMIEGETAALALSSTSLGLHTAGTVMDVLGGILAAIPDFDIGVSGFGGSPTAKVKTGGVSFSKVAELAARAMYQTSTILDKSSSIATTVASYQRRQDDWDFQKDLAVKEIEQIDKSIAAAELRIAIAEKELENHVLQIENAKAADAFMRSKYTNQELYQWQVGEISRIYFETYKLAYDLAKRAERCFRFELGLQDSDFIKFGYWDSLKKGLLSGEKLQYDLRRMGAAYLEQNRREHELTKHISLHQLDPLALLVLKATGTCEFTVPEWLFDLDTPGHYMRRIKSVSLSIPAVAGPYTSVNCTLTLLGSTVRRSSELKDGDYPRASDGEDDRFVDYYGTVQSIATSNAQNDSGLFETNLRDERYLPFEGLGAISTWRLELPAEFRQFDYNTISDVILHMRYTAREGGSLLKEAAISNLENVVEDAAIPGLALLFSLRHDFPNEWQQFVSSEEGNLEITIKQEHFPYFTQEKEITVDSVLVLRISDGTLKYAKPSMPQFSLNSENRTYLLSLPSDDNVLVRDNKASVFLLLGYHLQ